MLSVNQVEACPDFMFDVTSDIAGSGLLRFCFSRKPNPEGSIPIAAGPTGGYGNAVKSTLKGSNIIINDLSGFKFDKSYP